jgi:hypothetical protein
VGSVQFGNVAVAALALSGPVRPLDIISAVSATKKKTRPAGNRLFVMVLLSLIFPFFWRVMPTILGLHKNYLILGRNTV